MVSLKAAVIALAVGTVAAVKCPIKMNLTGHIDADKVMTFVYEPIEVPPGVSSISVAYSYNLKGKGNALDIGIFDQRGTDMASMRNDTFGSRGWSGGFRENFTVATGWATPGYNPGPMSPGTWYIVWGPYGSVPEGIDWNLSIEMSFRQTTEWFTPAYAASSLDAAPVWSVSEKPQLSEARWLRGDFHLHTVHSDGRYLPEEQIANAIARKLDFIFFTEHNTYSGNDVYGVYAASAGTDLLIGRGIEVTTRHGHWNALGLDRGQNIEWRYHPEDGDAGYAAAAAQVHRVGGVVSVSHPFAECGRCDWGFDWDNNDAIEVWNGPWDVTDERAVQKWQEFLVQGRRFIAIGGSDAHKTPDVTGLPTTVVLSEGLSQSAVLDGVRKGYAYLVREPEMSMALTVEGRDAKVYHIGQNIESKVPDNAEVKLEVAGFGSNGAIASWISEQGYLSNITLKGDGILSLPVNSIEKFLRAEVRDAEGNVLGLTNPIYFP